jgi:hypothetical protein
MAQVIMSAEYVMERAACSVHAVSVAEPFIRMIDPTLIPSQEEGHLKE